MVWGLRAHNRMLYATMLVTAVFVVIAALGPGLFIAETASPLSWQYQIFAVICHQDSARSFSVSGIQMAVCARCIGIYGTFLAGWLMMPLYAFFRNLSTKAEKNWLIAAILLNLGDVMGNYFGFWTNTHIFRLALGGILGWSLTLILSNEFFTFNK